MIELLSGPGFFRICLALMVYISHVSDLKLGVVAVYVFFVLSGFWISRMWSRKYSHSSRGYQLFLISRLMRIWPVFGLMSAVTWLLFLASAHGWDPFGGTWHAPVKGHTLRQVVANFFIFGYSSLPFNAKINGPAWSLDIEAQFYLVAPLVIYILSKLRVMVLAFIALSFAFILYVPAFILPRYIMFFAIGIFVEQIAWKPTPRFATYVLSGTFLLLVAMYFTPVLHGILINNSQNDDAGGKYNHIFSAALALLVLPCAIFTTSQKGWRHDGFLGEMSFIFYLVHYPILQFFGSGRWTAASLAASALVTALICYLVWRFYDDRIQGTRESWIAKKLKEYPYADRSPAPAGDRAGTLN